MIKNRNSKENTGKQMQNKEYFISSKQRTYLENVVVVVVFIFVTLTNVAKNILTDKQKFICLVFFQ